MTVDKETVEYLKDTWRFSVRNRKDEKWLDAFKYYNEKNYPFPLSANCAGCYYKVYEFIKKEHLKSTT